MLQPPMLLVTLIRRIKCSPWVKGVPRSNFVRVTEWAEAMELYNNCLAAGTCEVLLWTAVDISVEKLMCLSFLPFVPLMCSRSCAIAPSNWMYCLFFLNYYNYWSLSGVLLGKRLGQIHCTLGIPLPSATRSWEPPAITHPSAAPHAPSPIKIIPRGCVLWESPPLSLPLPLPVHHIPRPDPPPAPWHPHPSLVHLCHIR